MSVGSDSVLRRVLSKQMRLLNVNDNLNVADPDFPTDEVLKDAARGAGVLSARTYLYKVVRNI